MNNPFQHIFEKQPKSVLGVDIGPSSVKIVQLKKKHGRAVLETYGALALGPYAGIDVGRATQLPPDKVSEAITDLMREAKITARDCGVSIPMTSSLVTLIEVPAVDDKQMAQLIPLEARKYIPVPISEVMLDWWVIPKEESRDSDFSVATPEVGTATELHTKRIERAQALLVVIHTEAIQRVQEIVKLSGLNSSFYEIEIFSVIRSVLDRESLPAMIFDLGASATKLYIVDKGILRVSHIINRGSQDLTLSISQSLGVTVAEAENLKRTQGLAVGSSSDASPGALSPTLSYIFSEANRVILNYQKRYLRNLGKVVLTGGGAGLRGLYELAKTSFEVDVVPADPFAKVESPAYLTGVLRQVGPEFSVAVGLALRKLLESS